MPELSTSLIYAPMTKQAQNAEHSLAQHNHKDKIQTYGVLHVFPSQRRAKKVAEVKLLLFVPDRAHDHYKKSILQEKIHKDEFECYGMDSEFCNFIYVSNPSFLWAELSKEQMQDASFGEHSWKPRKSN